MSKIEDLKLRNIETLSGIQLMSTNSNSGSDSGYGSNSSSGSGSSSSSDWGGSNYGSDAWPCDDECTSDENCADKLGLKGIERRYAACNLYSCLAGLGGNYKRCLKLDKDEYPCKGKNLHDECEMAGGGIGYCSQFNVPFNSWRAKKCISAKWS